MAPDLEELRRRIDAIPVNHRGRRKYTASLRHDIVAYLKVGMAKGRSQASMAKELTIHQATLSEWLERGKSKAKKSTTSNNALARVEVATVSAPPRGSRSTELILALRGGHRVEGLTVESLADLLKALG